MWGRRLEETPALNPAVRSNLPSGQLTTNNAKLYVLAQP